MVPLCILGSLFGNNNVDLKLGGLFSSQQKADSETKKELQVLGEKIEKQTEKIQELEMAMNEKGFQSPIKPIEEAAIVTEASKITEKRRKSVQFNLSPSVSTEIDLNVEKKVDRENYWIEDIKEKFKDEKLGEGKVRYLRNKEKEFWRKMIDKYLLPLEQTKVV